MKMISILNEELNTKPAEIKVTRNVPASWEASFKINDLNYYFFATKIGDNDYDIEFGTKEKGTESTNIGKNVDKVFSTVLACIKQFVKDRNPDEIYFVTMGKDNKRKVIYSKFLNKINKHLPNYEKIDNMENKTFLKTTTAFAIKRK